MSAFDQALLGLGRGVRRRPGAGIRRGERGAAGRCGQPAAVGVAAARGRRDALRAQSRDVRLEAQAEAALGVAPRAVRRRDRSCPSRRARRSGSASPIASAPTAPSAAPAHRPEPRPIAAAAPPSPARATLEGSVVAADGAALSEPRVTVQADADAEAAPVDVDGDGRFTFTGKPGQTLTIRAEAADYEPATETVTLADGPAAEVTLTLRRKLPSGQIRGLIRSFKGVGLNAEMKIDPRRSDAAPRKDGRFEADVAPGTLRGHDHRAGLRDAATPRRGRAERRDAAQRRSEERAVTRSAPARAATLAGRPGRSACASSCARRGEPVATLIDTQGSVERNDGSQAWTVAAPGFAFVVGDILKTLRARAGAPAADERAVIRVLENARIRFARGTLPNAKGANVNVELGSAEVESATAEVALVTALGVARIERGARVRVSSDGARATLEVVVGRAVLLVGGRQTSSSSTRARAPRSRAPTAAPSFIASRSARRSSRRRRRQPRRRRAAAARPRAPSPHRPRSASARRPPTTEGDSRTRAQNSRADVTLDAGDSGTLHVAARGALAAPVVRQAVRRRGAASRSRTAPEVADGDRQRRRRAEAAPGHGAIQPALRGRRARRQAARIGRADAQARQRRRAGVAAAARQRAGRRRAALHGAVPDAPARADARLGGRSGGRREPVAPRRIARRRPDVRSRRPRPAARLRARSREGKLCLVVRDGGRANVAEDDGHHPLRQRRAHGAVLPQAIGRRGGARARRRRRRHDRRREGQRRRPQRAGRRTRALQGRRSRR